MGDNNELRMRESVTLEEESKREMQLNEDKEEMIEMVNSEKKLTELLTSINSILKQHESRIERLEEDNKLKSLMYQKLDSSYGKLENSYS